MYPNEFIVSVSMCCLLAVISCGDGGDKKAEQKTAPPSPRDKVPAASGSTENEACEVICRRSKELGCKKTEDLCQTECKAMHEIPVCKDLMEEVIQCVMKEPSENWACNRENIAAIRPGFCNEEQRRFKECLKSSGG